MKKQSIIRRIIQGRGNPRLTELISVSVALNKAPMLIYLPLEETAEKLAVGKTQLDILEDYVKNERKKESIFPPHPGE